MGGGGGETVCFRGNKLNNWNYKITKKKEIWWANRANKGVQINHPVLHFLKPQEIKVS